VVREGHARLTLPGARQCEGIPLKALVQFFNISCSSMLPFEGRVFRDMKAAAHTPDFASQHVGYQKRKAWHRDAGIATLQSGQL